MSSYPIYGCGLPSKPRAAQPSMFQILSWPSDVKIQQKQISQNKQQSHTHEIMPETKNQETQTLNLKGNQVTNIDSTHQKKDLKNLSSQQIKEQTYKTHQSPSKPKQHMKQTLVKQLDQTLQNKSKTFIKSKIHQKQIKHELYSYEPVHLKSSRSKSALPEKKQTKQTHQISKKQEPQLDEKTIQERKQKIKEFQIFTRALPNSAFTTYYGKPAFQAYGRGTSGQNLKSFNIMPHKGQNHPKEVESHYTALLKGRNIKSKSYLPRKPIEQNLIQSQVHNRDQQLKNINFPLQKPDLIKSNRFATLRPETAKKAGPPIMQKTTINGIKRNQTEGKQIKKGEKKPKKIKNKKVNDGLKYMNQRQNLIDLLEEKKMRASQLAYKVTECYPSQTQVPVLKQSFVSKENWEQLKPAGKATEKCDNVSDLIHSKLVLKQRNN